MRKNGYQAGQGLGKNSDGIIHAFSAQQTDLSKTQNKTKKAGGWVQAASAMGKLVNLNEDTKKKEERERYGEESCVVCLENVVGGMGEVDEELIEDIGEECAKYG